MRLHKVFVDTAERSVVEIFARLVFQYMRLHKVFVDIAEQSIGCDTVFARLVFVSSSFWSDSSKEGTLVCCVVLGFDSWCSDGSPPVPTFDLQAST